MLDKTSPLPIYYQLKELIRGKIAEGVWKPGDMIPSERELSEQWSISRMTVRQALKELAMEGVLRREKGRGTYVAWPKVEQRLTRLTGFTEDMQRRGQDSSARVLRLEMIEASIVVAKALGITPGTPVLLLERLRLAGGDPLAIESSHLYFDKVGELLNEDFAKQSLYHTLAQRYDVIPTRAEQQVEATICLPSQCELLGLDEGSAILHNRRVTYDQYGHAFEYTDSAYRGDRYIFYVELSTL